MAAFLMQCNFQDLHFYDLKSHNLHERNYVPKIFHWMASPGT